MHRSKIEWVRNPDNKTLGWAWNPLTGCLNHIDGMCKGGGFPCYAYKLANGRLKQRYLANKHYAEPIQGNVLLPNLGFVEMNPFYPRFWEDRIYDIPTAGGPKGLFVCDMGELFGNWIPEQWQERIFAVFEGYPNHRFYLLTKQPQNLIKFSPFPENCWVGVTATDSASFALACGYLRDVEAAIKYLSIEPYLGMIINTELTRSILRMSKVKQVIIGAQTNPYKPPKIEWVQEIVEACDKAGVAVFLKDNLKPAFNTLPYEDNKWFWSSYGQLRQEMPNA